MKYLLIFLLLVGCGTRKLESEIFEGIEINNTYSTGSKIVLGTNLTFTPFDNSKPFKVDGKKYSNVVVSSSTNKIVEKWKIKIIYRTKTIYQTKIIEKKDNSNLWIGIVFVVGLFVFLWFKLK